MIKQIENVCANCVGEADSRAWVANAGDTDIVCDLCGGGGSPTVSLEEFADYMRGCLENYYGNAAEQLPYESREGGYQGATWDTYDLLDENGFGFVDDDGSAMFQLAEMISDRVWCEYDWLRLDLDRALGADWQRFCGVVKHQRRYFFHDFGADSDEDERSPSELLRYISRFVDRAGLVECLPSGCLLYRAREDDGGGPYLLPEQLGPPPQDRAIQANRMNPPGIPMMYVSLAQKTAIKELNRRNGFLGTFETTRDARVLNLKNLPDPPGIFSGAEREERLGLKFLREFAREITRPVPRDKRVHIEYLPSQVVTEYFRGYAFDGGQLDGIKYGSAVDGEGTNIVLFARQENLVGVAPKADSFWGIAREGGERWIKLIAAQEVQYRGLTTGKNSRRR